MSDEGIELLNQIISSLSPSFFVTTDDTSLAVQKENIDVSRRIGVAKGQLGDISNFSKWDEEIASLFEGIGE